jgi:hypothetical protein
MSNLINDYYTYNNKRKCLHCGAPIADQKHSSTKFCPRVKLSDGTIQSCKDDYHSPLRKDRNAPYKRIAEFHKDAHRRINCLLDAKGETVTVEQINQYGINLYKSFEMVLDSMQRPTFRFVEFEFIPLGNKQYKINKHGKLF